MELLISVIEYLVIAELVPIFVVATSETPTEKQTRQSTQEPSTTDAKHHSSSVTFDIAVRGSISKSELRSPYCSRMHLIE